MNDLIKKLASGKVRVIDLTHTLSPEFPSISLPPEMGQAWPFASRRCRATTSAAGVVLEQLLCGEHTGTHFDAPVHWVSERTCERRGRQHPGAELRRPAFGSTAARSRRRMRLSSHEKVFIEFERTSAASRTLLV